MTDSAAFYPRGQPGATGPAVVYARGTADLSAVGGQATVVVAWDPNTQTVLLTHRDLAGTIDPLYVPTANRTAAGFLIIAANGADDSTVDWVIV